MLQYGTSHSGQIRHLTVASRTESEKEKRNEVLNKKNVQPPKITKHRIQSMMTLIPRSEMHLQEWLKKEAKVHVFISNLHRE